MTIRFPLPMQNPIRLRRHRTGASVLVVALLCGVSALADVTPLRPPGTCVSSPGAGGQTAWTNTANATSSTDGQARTATGTLDAATPAQVLSEYLRCTNFGFAVPDGSVINGITMQVSRRHSQSGQIIADGHIQPVLPVPGPGPTIGGMGSSDLLQTPCNAGNDWATTYNTVTYGGATNTWGITNWGACASSNRTCGATSAINVNHPDFGVAVAAKACSGNGAAWIDWVQTQIAFTPPSCNAAPWSSINVASPGAAIPGSNHARAQASYVIDAVPPSAPGCALLGSSEIKVKFSWGTNQSAVTSGTVSAGSATNVAIDPATFGHPAPDEVTFRLPAGVLGTCSGQPCLQGGMRLTLNDVTNPAAAGSTYTVTISATMAANGDTGSATSSALTFDDPCIGGPTSGAWAPLTVALSSDKQSIPAGPGIPACVNRARYTIVSRIPLPGGCSLVANTSKLEVTLPAGTDVAKVDAATLTIGTGTAMPFATPTKTGQTVTLTTPVDVPSNSDIKITLDVVKNPDSPSTASTLTLRATSTLDGGTETTPSSPYAITSATSCARPLDFYVRDWTTSATAHDEGAMPPPPAPNWASTSDVWNQYSTGAPVLVNDWVAGTNPAAIGPNFAFARISLRAPAVSLTYTPDVTAQFYAAPFGSSPTFFKLVGPVTMPLGATSTPAFVNVAWPPQPDVFLGVGAGAHLCLAVEITAEGDPLTSPTINLTSPDLTSKNFIEADNNQAQRNLTLLAMPSPLPPPPPPGGGGGMGGSGGMWQFAMIHNGTLGTRDIVLRFEAGPEVVKYLRAPRVQVIGGASADYAPGGSVTLPGMQPAEDRWLAFSYGLEPGAEGKLLPVGFGEMAGEQRVSGFAFGIQPSPLKTILLQNLRLHQHVFGRLGAAFASAEGKRENAAAALLREREVSEESYGSFLAEHRPAIDAAVTDFAKSDPATAESVGLAGALRAFDEGASGKDLQAAAIAHLALLERIDVVQNMREIAKGNPLDIVQLVRWQKELYTTRPALADPTVATDVVTRSEAFIATALAAKDPFQAYTKLMAGFRKDFRVAAEASKKQGVDVAPALAQLEKPGVDVAPGLSQLEKQSRTGVAALAKAHRNFLLAIDALPVGRPAAQSRR